MSTRSSSGALPAPDSRGTYMCESRRASYVGGLRGAPRRLLAKAGLIGLVLVVPGPSWSTTESSTMRYLDESDGRDSPGYGRTFGEQHYSPLTQVTHATIDRLNLA